MNDPQFRDFAHYARVAQGTLYALSTAYEVAKTIGPPMIVYNMGNKAATIASSSSSAKKMPPPTPRPDKRTRSNTDVSMTPSIRSSKQRQTGKSAGPSMKKNKKRRSKKRVTYKGKRKGRTMRKRLGFGVLGSVLKKENGGVVSDAQAVYIGHSTNVLNDVQNSFSRAIVFLLFQKVGINITSWRDTVPITSASSIYMNYYADSGQLTLTTVTYTWSTALTYQGVAENFFAAIRTAFSNSTVHNPVSFRFEWNGTSQAFFPATDVMLSFSMLSILTVQNQSLGGTTLDGDDNILAISNNPLVGKLYTTKGNYFEPKWRASGDASYLPLLASNTTGLIKGNATDSIPEVLIKPPPPTFFGSTKSIPVTMKPGQIVKSTLRTNTKISLIKYFDIMENDLNVSGNYTMVDFGDSAMFGMEKMLDNRTTENAVSLSYELNYTCSSYAYMKGRRSIPAIHDVGTSAI